MFGYVVANNKELTKDDLLRYRACYCGLCRTLKKRYGQAGRITLTYDMTFLILLLSSLYEPDSAQGNERCAVHPAAPHLYWLNQYTDYAADMNIALAYHNCMDDWRDDKNVFSLAEAALLKKKYKKLEHRYPRQCGTIERCLSNLALFERDNNNDLDAAANCFGELMGELFVCEQDNWSDVLRRMAAALGRFIYMMDAFEDVGPDSRKHRYNPLLPLYQKTDFNGKCLDILKLFMGECAAEFEKLPIVQDIDILRNILYSGVWTKYSLLSRTSLKRNAAGAEPGIRMKAEERTEK